MLLFISFLAGAISCSLYYYFPFSVLSVIIFSSLLLVLKKKFLPVVFISLGFFTVLLRYSPATDMPDIWNRELHVTGKFTRGSTMKGPGSNSEAFVVDRAWEEESGEEIEELQDREFLLPADFSVDYDDRYELLLQTGRDPERKNPGQQRKSLLYGKIITAEDKGNASFPLLDMFDRQRKSLDRYMGERFKGDSAAFIASLTTGNMAGLSDKAKEAFGSTGLAHILSISGTHFGTFSAILFALLGFLIKKLPYRYLQRLTIYLTPGQASALLSLPFMIMYLGISGGSIPAVRSFIMISLFLFGLLIGRKGFWLNSLLFAAVVIVLWDPAALTSLSFQLSFLAVLFIGFSVDKKDHEDNEDLAVQTAPENLRSRVFSYIRGALLISVSASLGTAPLAAYHFHYFSLVSPLANLLIVPLVGFMLIPLSLTSSFAYIFTGHYIFAPLVSASSELTLALVNFFARLPGASLSVPAFPLALCLLFYLGFVPHIIFGRNRKLLLLPFVPFCVYALFVISEKKDLRVTFLDVGQGDSAVLELPDNRTLVVDTGRTGKETAAFLKYLGKKQIDALLLTHNHPDHTGGLTYLMAKFHVKELWDNGQIYYPPELNITAAHRSLERGDTIEGHGYCITVLHPYRGFYTLENDHFSEENSSSVVLKVTGGKRSFLFAGDIEEEAEEDIAHLKAWLPVDVMKVPHHGSRISTSDEFLEKASPSFVVISVGRDNPFGHPSQEVFDKLEGSRIFRTDKDGAVKIVEKNGELIVKTCREFMLQKADNIRTEGENIMRLFTVW